MMTANRNQHVQPLFRKGRRIRDFLTDPTVFLIPVILFLLIWIILLICNTV